MIILFVLKWFALTAFSCATGVLLWRCFDKFAEHMGWW